LDQSKKKTKEEVTKDTHCVPWTINNKYYKADVQFWIDAANPKESNEETKKHWKEIGNVIEAFIFVFDKYKVYIIKLLIHIKHDYIYIYI